MNRIKKLLLNQGKWETVTGVPPLTLSNSLGKPLKDYKIYGNNNMLPPGYTQLSYIEATGEQYIDTGISPDINTQVDYKVRFVQDSLVSSPLIGARVGSANTARFFPIAYANPNTEFRTALGNAQAPYVSIDFNIDYEGSFQPQNEISIINGVSYSLSGNIFAKTDNYNMYLFATSGYTGNLYQSKGVIYYVKIYQNGVLVRNFIPCKNASNVVGMYDVKNDVFYQNAGTGTFGAGAEMATPTNPIEIESVGDKTSNLIPYPYYNSDNKTTNGIEYTVNQLDRSISAKGTATATAYYYLLNENLMIQEDSIISVSGLNSLIGIVYLEDGNSKYLSSNTPSRTISAGAVISSIRVYVSKDRTVDLSGIKVQLEKGSTPTEYEPYGKYKVPITVSGKNLFNPNDLEAGTFDTTTGLPITGMTGQLRSKYKILCYPGENFIQTNSGGYTIRAFWYKSDDTYISSTAMGNNTTYVTPSETAYMKFATGTAGLSVNYQIERGSTATSYAPYISNTYKIYLDEPLRKVGDVADYIDFETGKVVRNISEFVLDENSDWETYKNSNYTGFMVKNILPDRYYSRASGISNQSPYVGVYTSTRYSNAVWVGVSNRHVFWVYQDDYDDTLEDYGLANLKARLAVTPLVVDYVSNSPTEESIQLPSVLTIKGNNTISVETKIQPSNMSVIYKRR